MRKIQLGQAISVAANLGVIAGIAFLAFEVSQNTQAAKITAADNYVSSINEANNSAIDNPHLAAAILKAGSGERLLPEEEFVLTLFWSNTLRNWYRAYFLYEEGVLDPSFWDGQRNAITRTLTANPSLYDFWGRRRDDYEAGFNEILESFSAR